MSDVRFNDETGRYEMEAVPGQIVFAKTHRAGDVVYIDHVEAPESLRGTGAAGVFMKGMMDMIRAGKFKAVPVCGYASSWLRRHPEYDDLKGS